MQTFQPASDGHGVNQIQRISRQILCVLVLLYEKVRAVSLRVLSFIEKPPTVNKEFRPPLNLVPKKVLVIAFRINVTLDVKIGWFGSQVAVCVKKLQKNANFGFSLFQKFNFDCLLLKLLICSSRTKNILSFVCPLRTRSSGMISGTQIYSTLFLAKSDKS